MYPLCYFDGKIIPAADAAIAINDLAVVRGYGIFDFLRTYNLKPFLPNQYINRMMFSALQLNLNIDESQERLLQILDELIRVNNITKDIGIRMVVTGGASENCFTPQKPLLYIMVEDLHHQPEVNYLKGIQLISQEFLRQFPKVKTVNYLNAVLQFQKLKIRSDQDILYVWEGQALETPRSNFFLVKNGVIVTAAEDVLIGCTRNFVIQLAKDAGYKVEERIIKVEELQQADETFITGTTKNITPVVQIDDIKIGDGSPGKITKNLMERFREKVKQY